MPSSVVTILNSLPSIGRYLELGVGGRQTFDAVCAESKVGVDMLDAGPDVHKMTTDEFFAAMLPEEQFDVVFIDACHDYPQVLRDFNNAAVHCARGIVFLHDMVPPSAELTAKHLCSDSFKLLWGFIRENQSVMVLDADFGLTAVLKPQPLEPDPSWGEVTYEQFGQMELPTVSLEEMTRAVGSATREEVASMYILNLKTKMIHSKKNAKPICRLESIPPDQKAEVPGLNWDAVDE